MRLPHWLRRHDRWPARTQVQGPERRELERLAASSMDSHREVGQLLKAHGRHATDPELRAMAWDYVTSQGGYMPATALEVSVLATKGRWRAMLHPFKTHRSIVRLMKAEAWDETRSQHEFMKEVSAVDSVLQAMISAGKLTRFKHSSHRTMSHLEHRIAIAGFSESLAHEITVELRDVTGHVLVERMG